MRKAAAERKLDQLINRRVFCWTPVSVGQRLWVRRYFCTPLLPRRRYICPFDTRHDKISGMLQGQQILAKCTISHWWRFFLGLRVARFVTDEFITYFLVAVHHWETDRSLLRDFMSDIYKYIYNIYKRQSFKILNESFIVKYYRLFEVKCCNFVRTKQCYSIGILFLC